MLGPTCQQIVTSKTTANMKQESRDRTPDASLHCNFVGTWHSLAMQNAEQTHQVLSIFI